MRRSSIAKPRCKVAPIPECIGHPSNVNLLGKSLALQPRPNLQDGPGRCIDQRCRKNLFGVIMGSPEPLGPLQPMGSPQPMRASDGVGNHGVAATRVVSSSGRPRPPCRRSSCGRRSPHGRGNPRPPVLAGAHRGPILLRLPEPVWLLDEDVGQDAWQAGWQGFPPRMWTKDELVMPWGGVVDTQLGALRRQRLEARALSPRRASVAVAGTHSMKGRLQISTQLHLMGSQPAEVTVFVETG